MLAMRQIVHRTEERVKTVLEVAADTNKQLLYGVAENNASVLGSEAPTWPLESAVEEDEETLVNRSYDWFNVYQKLTPEEEAMHYMAEDEECPTPEPPTPEPPQEEGSSASIGLDVDLRDVPNVTTPAPEEESTTLLPPRFATCILHHILKKNDDLVCDLATLNCNVKDWAIYKAVEASIHLINKGLKWAVKKMTPELYMNFVRGALDDTMTEDERWDIIQDASKHIVLQETAGLERLYGMVVSPGSGLMRGYWNDLRSGGDGDEGSSMSWKRRMLDWTFWILDKEVDELTPELMAILYLLIDDSKDADERLWAIQDHTAPYLIETLAKLLDCKMPSLLQGLGVFKKLISMLRPVMDAILAVVFENLGMVKKLEGDAACKFVRQKDDLPTTLPSSPYKPP